MVLLKLWREHVWREHAECRHGRAGNNLGPGDVTALAEALKVNKALTTLDVIGTLGLSGA
eukprot:24255-Pleurochrysis_carterae.AAC.1